MLRPDDLGLIERDGAIRGLREVLDEEAFAGVLRGAFPDADVISCRAYGVRYKPCTSCLVSYRVMTAAGEVDVYASALGISAPAKLAGATKRVPVKGLMGPPGVAVVADAAIVVHAFPNDHELGGIACLMDPDARRRLLQEIAPARDDLAGARLHRLRYKPERRFVGRLDVDGVPRAVVKCFHEKDFKHAATNAGAFAPRGPLVLADRLGWSDRRRITAWAWVHGRPLGEALFDESALVLGERIGAAAAALHGQQAAPARLYSAVALRESLDAAARLIGAVAPELGAPAGALAARLSTAVETETGPPRPLHGDFSPDQVLVMQDRRIALIDLDRAGLGDPAYDLGTYLARLEFDSVLGGTGAPDPAPWRVSLLDGYRAESGADLSVRLDAFTAASLLMLGPEPFRKRHDGWRRRIGSVLCRAQELSDRGHA